MTEPARIDILLATYNGESYVTEQVDSVFRQTYANWRILARDDGSNDGTVNILRRFAEQEPDHFVLIENKAGNLGYVGNFSKLMEESSADYLAFCDQDDVWLPDRLSLGMKAMKALEEAHGALVPLLVHSDMKVVDRDLREIRASFWDYQALDPNAGNQFNRLLVQNVVTGCTTLLNRPLKDLSLPIPAEAKAHDWWMALVAAAFGAIGYVIEPTVLYRQHEQNAIGAKADYGAQFMRRVFRFIRNFSDFRESLQETFAQATEFWNRYGDALSSEHADLLRRFLATPDYDALRRLYYAKKLQLLPPRRGYAIAYTILTHGMTPQRSTGPKLGGLIR